ncbi:MAG TPA: tetratricopeptide repeat protein [Rhizomicrobium sp.]|jgi:Flp pilus assembly protein TadD
MKRFLASTAAIALCAFGAAQADEAAKPATDVTTELSHAHALRQAGQLPEAASALAQIMLMAPDDVRVIGEYGKVMAQENRGQDAIAFLRRATEIDPNDWSLWSALGVGYDESNDSKNAASAYQRALALKPGEPAVLNNYGMSRMLAGDMAGAQMMFAQARGNDPKVTNNAALLAEIQASRMPARMNTPAPTQVKAQQSAEIAPKPQMQQPKPQMAAATPAPKAMAVTAAPAPSKQTVAAATPSAANTNAAPTATGAPRAIASGGVVMQAVPKDPLAGPVKPKVMAHKAVAKPTLPAPALRTAADTH